MVVSNSVLRAGLVVGGMVLAGGLAVSQNPQQDATQKTPAAVPDAPRPQTLPKLNTITPVGPAYPDAPAPAATTTSDGTTSVPSALPSSPTPQIDTQDVDAAPIVPAPGTGAEVFKLAPVQVNLIQLPFTVKDSKGQLVPAITPRDVRVYENGLRQRISYFTSDPFPLSVAFVVDQSVPTSVMTSVNNALGALQGAFTPYDEIAVFTYNNGVRAQGGGVFTGAQSARLGAVLQRSKGPGREPNLAMGSALDTPMAINNRPVDPNINRSNPAGVIIQRQEKEYHTLNDAVLQAAEAVAKAQKGRRRLVYVISDGKEYGSKASQKEVIRYLQTNNIAVYATLVGDSSIPGFGFIDRIHLPFQMRDDILPRYAAATGGQCDPEFRQRGIENSFAKISEEVRAQYTLAYYSHEPMLDGKYRHTEIKIERPNLTIITKAGYYPTPSAVGPASTPVSAPAAAPAAQ